MKLFTTGQIAELDKYTIENEPVADIDLMERAAMQLSKWIARRFTTGQRLVFFVGPGNNGGDALAVARQLTKLQYQCQVYLMDMGKSLNGSPKINWERLKSQGAVKLNKMQGIDQFPETVDSDILIDGLFGSGLNRPLEKFPAELVRKINATGNTIISIDIPSGLMGQDNFENSAENIIRANYTLTFQFPKLSFFFPENEKFTGIWEVLPIGMHPDGIANTKTDFQLIDHNTVCPLIPDRKKFSHKGTFGHALLIAGSYGKMGAAVLSAKACLHAGAGLVTAHVPRHGYSIIQTAVPEVMASIDQHDSLFTEYPELLPFSAIGIGPGLGKKHNSCRAFSELLEKAKVPLVIDADGLNILSEHPEWMEKIPEGSVLTPHPGEFKRLVGDTENSWERLQKQREFAHKYNVVVVLKGAYTSIATPDSQVYFNSTGNPGMATGGTGDVLTGVILGLLAQGMPSRDAAIVGVYLHGLAGDIVAKLKSEYALIASDISDNLGSAFLQCLKSR